ncbi:hypothetical protein [Tychonema sp. LEGE 07203]|uniref:hypothetical protein n=1 Tax=Tychonema sp. LEGE 07203 TaxID=1828671 RepID=UPI001D144C88|nr:hypothetical protein [Tychonema sp. LEGE 07203]
MAKFKICFILLDLKILSNIDSKCQEINNKAGCNPIAVFYPRTRIRVRDDRIVDRPPLAHLSEGRGAKNCPRNDKICTKAAQGDRPQAISTKEPSTLSPRRQAHYTIAEKYSLPCGDRTYAPAPFCAKKYYL